MGTQVKFFFYHLQSLHQWESLGDEAGQTITVLMQIVICMRPKHRHR